MANYGNFNINRKRKGNKIIIAVVCIAVLLLAAVFYIGITAGSDGEGMERISSAVAENTQLKQEISELNDEIERMRQEIDELNAQLEAHRAIEPVQRATPSVPSQSEGEPISPRSGIR